MAGFKLFTLWTIIIASMAITGCVPQAKQTECGANEAFSPTQRRCLPVNPSETSFIKIKSPVPTGGITATASSGSSLSFTIMVENPYNRTYRIRWIRNFNGSQTTLYTPSAPSADITDHPYTISLIPNSDLYGAVGNHIVTAQILDATSNSIIDSHDFSLQLTNDPTPNGQNFSPGLSLPITQNPINVGSTFSFNVLNNGRKMDTPLVRWRLIKLTGTTQPDLIEVDPLINTDSPQMVSFAFNPSNPLRHIPAPTAPFNDYVGNYRLEASIMDGITNFSTYSWDITILHPSLGFIVNSHTPVPGDSASTIRAFNGVPYSNLTSSNFSFGGATRSQFCVRVSDPDGRYGNGVTVRYYLGNSTGHVYEGTTSSSDDEVCLSDAPPAVQNAIVFSNANADLSWSTSITAKVFDTQTGEEYSRYDAGAYPLLWNIQVEPQNLPPVLTFVDTGTSVTCGSQVGSVRNNCQITQDNGIANNILRVAFSVQDEHGARVAYTGRLTRGATTVDSSCQKLFSDPHDPVFTCEFRVPSHDTLGSIDPTLDQWRVSVEVTDENSPYTSVQKVSSLTWNLNVREINYAPTITSVNTYLNTSSTITFTEKETAIFQVQLNDPERDEYVIQLARCSSASLLDSVCSTLLTTPRTYLSDGDYHTNRRLAFTIPDGFLPANTLSESVIFRIKVINYASTATADTQIPNEAISSITLTINNHNPAPVFANIGAIDIVPPSMADTIGIDYLAFGSFPLTLDPATVTDASELAAEANITYQWWIAPHTTGTPSWSQINDATSRVLSWTPGSTMLSGNYFIKLCATDGYPTRASVDPNVAGTYCNNPAVVAVHNNFLAMTPIATNLTAEGQFIVGAPAVWIDTSTTGEVTTPNGDSRIVYSAFAVHNLNTLNFKIHVQKSVYNIDGTGEMRILSELEFDAIDPFEQTPDFFIQDVKDLRLVGDEDSLYIAYLANFVNDSHDLSYKPEVRRIYKGLGRGQKTAPNLHQAPFAFNYEGFYVDHSQNPCTACWAGADSAEDLQILTGSITLDTSNLLSGSTISLGYSTSSYPLTVTAAGVDSTDLALNLANAINSHTELGFTAIHHGGASLTIHGPIANEDARVLQVTNKLGQIWVDSNYLYVPYINLSAAAPNNKVISVERIQNDSTQSLYLVSTQSGGMTTTLLGGTHSNDFDNAVDRDGNVIIAYADNASKGNLIKFAGTDFTTGVNYSIMGARNVQKIRLSANTPTNNFYYVMGQAGDTSIALTRLESDLTTADFTRIWSFDQSKASDASTTNFFTDFTADGETLYDFAIQAASTDTYSVTSIAEARILISSSLGVHAFKTLSNNTVSCGSCHPISRAGADISTAAPLLGVSNILENQTIATAGNISPTNNENIRDILGFTYIDSSVADRNILHLGIINTERVQINSTTRDLANGYYTPSIFKY